MRKIFLLAGFVVLIMATSCDRKSEIVQNTIEQLENRNFKEAINIILEMRDKQILNDTSYMRLLSTAYNGLAMNMEKGIAANCYDMDFSSDGKIVYFTDFDRTAVSAYSYPELKQKFTIPVAHHTYNIDISPDGKLLAAASADSLIHVYDIESTKEIRKLKGHRSRTRDVAFLDNNLLFSGSNDQYTYLWDVKQGKEIWNGRFHSKNIKSLNVSKDKTRLLSASNDGAISVIKIEGLDDFKEKNHLIHNIYNYVNEAVFSPDDKKVASVSGAGTVILWDLDSNSKEFEVELVKSLCSVAFSEDGKYLAVGSYNFVFVLDAETGEILNVIPVEGRPVGKVKFIGNDKLAFIDNFSFYQCDLLFGQDLIDAARKLAKK